MRDTKVQWHPGFTAAMGLELAENQDDLIFQKEYNLNTKPLEIDLLVIRKNADTRIENEIGNIFRGHNIMEYKSPDDHLNIDTFYKAEAYAGLYKSYGQKVDEIKAEDITVSLVRDSKPLGLLWYLKEHGCLITNQYRGIYYIEGKVLFPTQIVVTRELNESGHIWLRVLSEKISIQEMENLVEKVRGLEGKFSRELADSVLEVSIQANEQRIEEWKGGGNMGPALMRLMQPELDILEKEAVQRGMERGMQEGMQEGVQTGIQKTIEILQDLGHENGKIVQIVKEKYSLTDEEIEKYINNK